MFDQNLQLIRQRWPQLASQLETTQPPADVRPVQVREPSLLVQGLQLTSCYDRRSEAQLQASLVPRQSRRVQVYGLALGDLPRVLLEGDQLEELNVFILNFSLARTCLEHFDHRDWLSDSRVNLLTGAGLKQPDPPFAAAPVCLQLAEDAASALRDRIVLELSTPEINRRCGVQNAALQQRLRDNEPYVERDEDVALYFGHIGDKRAVIAAAGPSLAEHYAWLREQRAEIWLLALDASLKPLLAAGIEPDLVLCIDPHEELIIPFFNDIDPQRLRGMALVYFPLVHHRVLDAWPGPRLCAYARHPLYAGLLARHPRGCLFSSGSVLHPAVDLAVKAGAAEVTLCGADFSYPQKKTHVDGCVVQKEFADAANPHWVLNGFGERVPTHLNMRGFLRDLEGYIESHPRVRFVNASRSGAAIAGTHYPAEAL